MEQIVHVNEREYDLFWMASRLADEQKMFDIGSVRAL